MFRKLRNKKSKKQAERPSSAPERAPAGLSSSSSTSSILAPEDISIRDQASRDKIIELERVAEMHDQNQYLREKIRFMKVQKKRNEKEVDRLNTKHLMIREIHEAHQVQLGYAIDAVEQWTIFKKMLNDRVLSDENGIGNSSLRHHSEWKGNDYENDSSDIDKVHTIDSNFGMDSTRSTSDLPQDANFGNTSTTDPPYTGGDIGAISNTDDAASYSILQYGYTASNG
mmetsp:Transcript_17093/g.20869  ORF Transcript_17093/g.20869 Transcript_17093/m.20869 type:complete len:227 (-) Transcript_17093:364-1044(-)